MILLQALSVALVVPTGSLTEPFSAASTAIFEGCFVCSFLVDLLVED
jgi:hypothetical protein